MVKGIRFIIGSDCNYKCFYCHHEGVKGECVVNDYKKKINYIAKYCYDNSIHNISITGGEPFLYSDELFYILNKFNNEKYHISINTNASLIHNYISLLTQLDCSIELHVNFSSLKPGIHYRISGTHFFEKLIQNVMLLKNTKIKICLNTILLKGINDNEIEDMLDFCDKNGFLLRLLQYLPNTESEESLVINQEQLKTLLPNVKVSDIMSYGIYKCEYSGKNFEFVKNLCCDKLCERCKEYTFVHFTPALDIKMCMSDNKKVIVDYSNYKVFENTLNKIQNGEIIL